MNNPTLEKPSSLGAQAMAARALPYMEGLNAEQRAAVEIIDGPLLVLAGAGTGKTRTLTTRLAHILHKGGARSNEILAVTFTNKAAREMKARVAGLLGGQGEIIPWLGTFHSIAAKILRRHSELLGLKSNFTILDKDDQIRLLKQLIVAHNIDEKRWPARLLAYLIEQSKNRALTPMRLPKSEQEKFDGKLGFFYAAYQERLKSLNAADFGDLLLHNVTLFQENQDILEKYQRWFRYIFVDEYQDTNVAQYLWLRLLAGAHKNICCVGDDDQSIYGWRGAEVSNILRFEKDFLGAKTVRLEQNYRSSAHILEAASGVISCNNNRLGKKIWTKAEGGEKLCLVGFWDEKEEARWIAEECEARWRGARASTPVSLNDIAILVRASRQMRPFEDRFLEIGLPYRVIGGPRFYERMEIRDAIAYFRLVVSADDALAFERIVNVPSRGVGPRTVQKIQTHARAGGISLTSAAKELVVAGALTSKARKSLSGLLASIENWSAQMRQGEDHIALAERILDESGYTGMWQNDKTPKAPERLENLCELVKTLNGFENLSGFLEHVALVMDNETEGGEEKVSLMTLHSAKGLEFPAVFLPGWEEGLFPSERTLDESGSKGLEEERRLAYVGITRARALCTISFATNRLVFGTWKSVLPSRFIDELPEKHIEILTPPELYGGGKAPLRSVESYIEEVGGGDTYNAPGWKRLKARAREDSALSQTPYRAGNATNMGTPESEFKVGARVFHNKFGYGKVVSCDGNKLEIEFQSAGRRRIISQFVVAAEQADKAAF